MKDIIYIVLFITLLITLQSSSCNKTDEPQTHCDSTNTVYLPEDARSRFFFKEGTWWVYKNITNNNYDTISLIVENYGIYPVPKKIFGDGFSKCYEGYVYNIISKPYERVNVTLSDN